MRTLRGEKDWEILVFWDTVNACHSLEQEKSEYKGKTNREKADSVRVLSKFLLSAAICLQKHLDQDNYKVVCVFVHGILFCEWSRAWT